MREDMKKIRALILKGYEDNVLRILQKEKALALVSVSERSARWEEIPRPFSPQEEERFYRTLLSRVEKHMDRLGIREELGILDQLFKPRTLERVEVPLQQEDEILSAAEERIAQIEMQIRVKIDAYEKIQEFLWKIREVNIQVQDLQPSDQIHISIGSLRSEEIEELEEELESKLKWTRLYVAPAKEGQVFFLIIAPNKLSESLGKILSEKQVQRLIIPPELTGTPSRCLRGLDLEVSKMVREHQKTILVLHDTLKAKISRIESSRMLGEIDNVVIMEGWVPAPTGEYVQKLIEEAAEGYATVLLSPPDEPTSKIPTKLKNPWIIQPFEILTEMYDTPAYDEIDPTPFLAFFFVLFMGLMSADIATGITTFLVGWLVYRGSGSRSRTMRGLALIIMYSGLSIILFGILSGEFMGGLIQLPVIWISTVDEPIVFMIFSLAVGVAHILVGLVLGIYNNLRKGRRRNIFTEQVPWIAVIAGVVVLFFSGEFTPGTTQANIGYGIISTALIALILGQGASALLDVTRIVSNVVSYVRILALNMATAWMSRTFLLLASIVVDTPVVGSGLGIAILVGSHLFLVALSSITTFIHSLRLHYVEFFGRFFEGGGVNYQPISVDREYTKLIM